jgi:hypothetical protein
MQLWKLTDPRWRRVVQTCFGWTVFPGELSILQFLFF